MQDSAGQFCASCGKPRPEEARFCQNCGTPFAGPTSNSSPNASSTGQSPQVPPAQNKGRARNFGCAGLIVIILIVAFVVFNHTPQSGTSDQAASSAVPADAPTMLPPSETSFIEVVSTAQGNSQRTENDMQKGGVKATRDKAICNTMTSPEVRDWIGTIQTIDSNSDGKGVLAISIAPDVLIKTWNNAISDIETHTLLEPGSPVFQTASALKVGQRVAFSGSFLQGNEGDCFLEGSMTLDGKLRSPEFIFQFSKISAYSSVPVPVQSPQEPNAALREESKPSSNASDDTLSTSLIQSAPNNTQVQPIPAGTVPETSPNQAVSDSQVEVFRALENWSKANESNDPTLLASCYTDQIDRYFLRVHVTNSFVHDYWDTWFKEHDSRVTVFKVRDVTFDNETTTIVQLRLVKEVVTTDSKGSTERLTHSELHLNKVGSDWKISSERDFK